MKNSNDNWFLEDDYTNPNFNVEYDRKQLQKQTNNFSILDYDLEDYWGIKNAILKDDIDVNYTSKTWNKWTALHFAAKEITDVSRTIKLLVKYGADILALNNKNQTPLDVAKKYATKENLKLIQDITTKAINQQRKEKLLFLNNI